MAALRRAVTATPAGLTGYGDPQGVPALRAALAAYLTRARGVSARPEDIVICAGYSHGLQLIADVLGHRGTTRVAMEDPGLPHHRAIVARAGLDVVRLPVDAEGADPTRLEGPATLVLTPAHQQPLGMTTSPARRRATVEWARARRVTVLEDDYDGELRYDRQPVGALQGLAPDRVIYAGTVSKSLSPGLRIGWLVAPPDLRAELTAAVGPHSPVGVLDQLALADFITSHRYERHLRRMRAVYDARRRALLALSAEVVPDWTVQGVAAGIHAVLVPPAPALEDATVALALRRGINLQGLGRYWHAERRIPGVLIGYGRPAEHAFRGALEQLAGLLRDIAT